MSQKTLIILIVLVVVAFVGYNLMSSTPVEEGVEATTTSGDIVGGDILSLVEKLKMITIDSSIFSSALFASLRDSSAPLTPEIQGRPNPFAVIGSDVSSGSVQTTATTTVR